MKAFLKFSLPEGYLSNADDSDPAAEDTSSRFSASSSTHDQLESCEKLATSNSSLSECSGSSSSSSEHSLPRVRVEVPSQKLQARIIEIFNDVCAENIPEITPVLFEWISRSQECLNDHESFHGMHKFLDCDLYCNVELVRVYRRAEIVGHDLQRQRFMIVNGDHQGMLFFLGFVSV